MIKLFITLLLCVLVTQTHALSISRISSSGADQNGYLTVTLEGSDFGAGPNVVLFDDFNSADVGGPVPLDGPLVGNWSPSSSYSAKPSVVSNNGDKAMQIYDADDNGSKIGQVEVALPTRGNDLFISYSVTVPQGKFFAGASEDYSLPSHSSWKFTWIADGPSAISSTTKFNLCTPTHVGGGNFMLHGNSGGLGYVSVWGYWAWHTKNYFSFGLIPDNNAPTSANGTYVWQHSGKAGRVNKILKDTSPVMPSGVSTGFTLVKFPGWFATKGHPFDAYYDDIYVAVGDNALARVELSDAEDHSASVKNVTMPVTSWSDTSIQVKIHESHFEANPSLFLRVYKADNSSITSSFIADASSTEPAISPPSPPANFSVN